MGITLKAMGFGAALSLAAMSTAQATELLVSSWVPPMHLLNTEVVKVWGEKVTAATEGRVTLNILPKAVSAPPGSFDSVRDGLADVSFTVHGYTPGRFVLTKLPEFPGMGDSAEAMSVAYHRIYEQQLAQANEHRGVKLLALWVHGPGNVYSGTRPVTKVEDLSGLKVRVGGGVSSDVALALNLSPLLRPSTESYELINAGIADGVLFPPESVEAFNLTKLIKHATEIPGGLYNVSFAMFMNEDTFNKLSEKDQKAIMEVSGESLSRLAGQAWDRADTAARAAMEEAGVQTVVADDAFMDAVTERTKGLVDDWLKAAAAKGVDGEAALAAYREEIKKVAAGN